MNSKGWHRFLKRALGLAFVGGSLFASSIGTSTDGAVGEIRIGEIDSLTGRFAAQGTALHQGILYAVEEANRSGGLRVVLLTRDDEGRPERATAAAEELISRYQVAALVGGYVDSLVGPVSEVAERHRTPYLATASLDERLTQRGLRYFFRMSSLSGYVEAMVGAVLDLFKPKRVAILSSSTPGASQLAEKQKERLEQAGVAVPVYEMFQPSLSDFTPLLTKVREEKVDLLLFNAFFADNLLLVRQLKGLGVNVKGFLGAFGMEFPEVIKELGSLSELIFGTTSWEPGITLPGTEAASKDFVQGFRRRFGSDPPPLAMHGYGAAKALIAAIQAVLAKPLPLNGETVRDALSRLDLLLPLERLRFSGTGEPREYQRVLIQIQQGRHVVVYPPERATGKAIYPMPPWKERNP